MKLILETNLKKDNKTESTLKVAVDIDELAQIGKTQGLAAANVALDKFMARYVADLKAQVSKALNS